ncbi:MAG: protein translocase subunit SecF [Nanoarchaeota archaeon]|nr:protein translocase subunit SecF [Nanoarchaeota archaeon]MBU4086490.1 protein translocase subunit SecF [Nanoarchaeota archaeon]
MSEHQQTPSTGNKKSEWYDKYYKIFFFIPVLLTLLSLVYLGFFFSQHNDFMLKDASLSGGTTITINGDIDTLKLESELKPEVPDVTIRKLTDLRSGKAIAVIVESSINISELKPKVEGVLGYELTTGLNGNSSIESTGATLSNNFYKQLIFALIISFILMSLVIFIMFRTFIPSLAVIFAAFSDIVMPLALINILGIRLSAAGIAAFLMLIGYSVDTDILLTTRALKKRDGTLNTRIFGAFKTGILMTLTALAAVLPAFFVITGLPESFRQIFLILALGLSADIFNTWLTNASIIKWYCEKKGIQ